MDPRLEAHLYPGNIFEEDSNPLGNPFRESVWFALEPCRALTRYEGIVFQVAQFHIFVSVHRSRRKDVRAEYLRRKIDAGPGICSCKELDVM